MERLNGIMKRVLVVIFVKVKENFVFCLLITQYYLYVLFAFTSHS